MIFICVFVHMFFCIFVGDMFYVKRTYWSLGFGESFFCGNVEQFYELFMRVMVKSKQSDIGGI